MIEITYTHEEKILEVRLERQCAEASLSIAAEFREKERRHSILADSNPRHYRHGGRIMRHLDTCGQTK